MPVMLLKIEQDWTKNHNISKYIYYTKALFYRLGAKVKCKNERKIESKLFLVEKTFVKVIYLSYLPILSILSKKT